MQPDRQKDPQAVTYGQVGGKQRMASMTAEEHSVFGYYAATARWHPVKARAAREQRAAVKLLVEQAVNEALKGEAATARLINGAPQRPTSWRIRKARRSASYAPKNDQE